MQILQAKSKNGKIWYIKGKVDKAKKHANKPALILRAASEAIKPRARVFGLAAWLAGPIMTHVDKWKPD
eukprot:2011864-Heterocapsa_arctica.AAC.1